MHEHLTRREALVAALAAATLGSGALARPAISRAAATARIGVILPLSKPGDTVAGSNVLKTVQLWVDWVNGRGGVDGQHVALSIYDDKADPDRGVKQFVRAVTHDHCAVILGGWDSRVARAEIEQAHKLQIADVRELRVVARHHEAQLPRGRAHRAEQRHARRVRSRRS